MEIVVRALVFAAFVILLVVGNVWLLRTAAGYAFGKTADVLLPFRVVGRDDPDGKLGASLAQMLIGRVGRIRQEMEASAQALEDARAAYQAPGIRPLNDSRYQVVAIPEQVFQPLDVKLSLGGVEVGGVLSWLHAWSATDHAMRLSVEYLEDRAIVAGASGRDNSAILYLEVPYTKNHEIVGAIAYSITQEQLARRIPEVSALEVKDFETLLRTLREAAQLNKQAALGAELDQSYEALIKKMEELTKKMPRWAALSRVAAQMAENANDPAHALDFYRRELAALDRGDKTRKLVQARIEELEQHAVAKVHGLTPVQSPTLPSSAAQDKVLARLASTESAQEMLKVLGVDELGMPAEISVAVLGGVPTLGLLPANSYQLVDPGAKAAKQDPMMTEYLDSVVQSVRLIAPRARLVFFPMVGQGGGAFGEPEIRQALKQLIAAKPQILLVTLGPLDGKAFSDDFKEAARQGTLAVLAAGNEPNRPFPFAGTPLLDQIMVVSAVDLKGKPASFAPKNEKAFWAPGVDIPVVVSTEKLEVRSGTTYSAALAAGVAARLYASGKPISPAAAVSALRASSRPLTGSEGVPVLNLHSALGEIALGAPPEQSK